MSVIGRYFGLGISTFVAMSLAISIPQASAETWSGFQGGSDGNMVRTSQPASRLGVAWTTAETIPSLENHCVSYGGGTVFTTIKDPESTLLRTLAVNASNGQQLWVTGAYKKVNSCPLVTEESVYVGYQRNSDDQWAVASLDPATGDQMWEHETDDALSILSGMAESNGTVLAFTQELIALDAEDGQELWSQPGRPSDTRTGPIVSGNTVIVSRYGSNGLVAYGIQDGTDLGWATAANDTLLGSAASGGVLYHRRGASTVVARSVPTGAVLWTRSLGAAATVSNVVADGSRVYAQYGGLTDWAGSYKVAALNTETGEFVWPQVFTQGVFASFLLRLGDWLYVCSGLDGERRLIDPENGQVKGSATGFPAGTVDFEYAAYGDRQFFQWIKITSGLNSGGWALVRKADNIPATLSLTSPLAGSYKASNLTLTWVSDDGFATPIDHFSVALNGGSPLNVPGGESELSLGGFQPGENQLEVTAVDREGNETTVSRQVTVNPSPVPVAGLSGPTGPVLSGTELTFDGSGSHDSVLDGQITRYEWDLDGDGSFELNVGDSPSIKAELSGVGTRNIAIRVTNDSGNSDTAAIGVDIRRKPLPGAGQVGISINDAALFTNDPTVKLKVKWPALASDLAISNDGGFATSSSFPLPANGIIEWKLRSSGPERLPKQVYVRYYGAGNDTVTYSDDIILDETPPVVQQASVVAPGAGTSASLEFRSLGPFASVSRKSKGFKVRLKARDGNSGVIAIQAAKSSKAKGPVVRLSGRARKISKVVNPRVNYRPRLVRVKDAAGNWTKFRRVR